MPNPDGEPLTEDLRPPLPALAEPGEWLGSLLEDSKRGANDSLVPEDVQTRYDLGVAYREMGLLEEAIEEFARCMDSSECRLDSLSMTALCCFDLGKLTEAVDYLKQALSTPELESSRREALLRELGRAYEALGDQAGASEVYASMSFSDPRESEDLNHNSDLEPNPLAFDESFSGAGETLLGVPLQDDSDRGAATHPIRRASLVQTGQKSEMDHLAFFGLRDDPFRAVPDSAFYVDTPVFADAQRRLARCLRQGKSLTLLVGAPGTGKSVVARRTLDALSDANFEGSVLATLPAAAGGGCLLERLARQFGVDCVSRGSRGALERAL